MPMTLAKEGSKENLDASSSAMLPKNPKATNPQNNIARCGDKESSYIGSSSYPSFDNSIYQSTIDSFPISGLCPNFDTAATILRLARHELRLDLIESENGATSVATKIVNDFYTLLQKVELYMNHRDAAAKDNSSSTNVGEYTDIRDKVFIVEIEGLDGSGKTTLCRSLTKKINNSFRRNGCNNDTIPYPTVLAIATKTPSPSLKQIRPLFDHRGGIVARAFYMVSNYILEYEIVTSTTQRQIMENNYIRVVIVDRWYASTLAYTVAYENEHENNEDHDNDGSTTVVPDVERLSKEVFAWPEDLHLCPNVLLVLQIDHDVRKVRVEHRKTICGKTSTSISTNSARSSSLSNDAAPSLYNPWDDRLDRDVALGQRILSALSKVHCENRNESTHGMMVRSINANHSMEEVLDEALGIVIPECMKFATEGKLCHDDALQYSQVSCLDGDSTSRPLRTLTPVLSKLTTQPILTVVLTGCHASGKTTIGQALAKILGWRFDPELGEVLRDDEDNLQPGGHIYGDGSTSCDEDENRDAWDDIVFDAEKRRDIEASGSKTCRIVETWHVGNANWYVLRQRSKDRSSDDVSHQRDINIDRYAMAVKEHKKSSRVLLVHLNLPSSNVVLDRRRQNESARKRLPLKNETKECEEMFQALQPRPEDMGSNLNGGEQLPSSWDVPTLHINNGSSGSAHIDNTIELILAFIEENYNRNTKQQVPLSVPAR